MKYNVKKIIIGSRESKLAKAHVEIFKENFYDYSEKNLDIELRTKFIKTSGDKFLSKNISEIGNKGLFTKEIDLAQLENKVDVGIHSLKDLPTRLPEGLEIVSILKRGSHEDVLYSDQNLPLTDLKQNSIVGTSSIRRKNQILRLRPDLIFKDLRGNVDSRIGKVKKGKLDAIILAKSGLERLGVKENYLSLDPCLIVPAVGQGAIALVVNVQNLGVKELLKSLNDKDTFIEVSCERAFLEALDGSCKTPVGAFAKRDKEFINFSYFASTLNGKNFISDKKKFILSNCLDESYNLGEDVKRQLKLV
jgi:hydroxymethylbilane synthase